MVSKIKKTFTALLLMLFCGGAMSQTDGAISISAGYRANFSKTSTIDRLTRYSLNYHAYAPGYYTSINVMAKHFFLRPSFSRYDIVHNHGVYNITSFTIDSPKNRNIRNSNSMMEFNLDFGYEFKVNPFTLRIYAGGGRISTTGQDWKIHNIPVPMIGVGPVEVTTSLEIFSQSFNKKSYTSNFGFGMYFPIYRKLILEVDVSYQTHFIALAANTGTYRTEVNGMPGFGGEFNSILTGAWILQVGLGYQFKREN